MPKSSASAQPQTKQPASIHPLDCIDLRGEITPETAAQIWSVMNQDALIRLLPSSKTEREATQS
jgi:hypothetical protein